jgi:hypothetical protein
MADEQCPQRGPGLLHVYDDQLRCEECRASKPPGSFSVADWIRAMGGFASIVTPRVVKVSGEPEEEPAKGEPQPDELKRGLNGLTAREWHALIVERGYHDSHDCDDR